MSLYKSIGGYFQLELSKGSFLHSDGVLLNTGRNCLEYILRTQNVTRLYIPKFICDAVLEPLDKLHIPYEFYKISENLEIKDKVYLGKDELILYANYFGLKDNYCNQLLEEYKDNLILDLSQAFYYKPEGLRHAFYSPRKFFGVSDGGVVYTSGNLAETLSTDISYQRTKHLLKSIEVGSEEAYEDFKKNEKSLSQQPIKEMSVLTQRIMTNINFTAVMEQRLINFKKLHEALGQKNKIQINNLNDCPMVYPYLGNDKGLKKRLINNKVFVATYWPNVLEWCQESELEYRLANDIVALPVDQRYSVQDMETVLGIINGS